MSLKSLNVRMAGEMIVGGIAQQASNTVSVTDPADKSFSASFG